MGKSWKKAGKLEVAAKKGALFTKFAREIQVAARMGVPDPNANSRLKMAVDAARAASVPKDTIERAIKKGSGQLDDGEIIEECTYEGYGPHGVGIIVECQTNNKTRTVSELRMLFKGHNGTLGEQGAVNWMFERVCLVSGQKPNIQDIEEEAIEVGANEVEAGENSEVHFYGSPTDLDHIRSALITRGWEITSAELSYKPKDQTELDESKKKEVLEFLEALEDFEDSHRVHASIQ